MAEPTKVCAICTHQWPRHDPSDGRCDAGPPCKCGRDLTWMRERMAELSRAALACTHAPATAPSDGEVAALVRRANAALGQADKLLLERGPRNDLIRDLRDALASKAAECVDAKQEIG